MEKNNSGSKIFLTLIIVILLIAGIATAVVLIKDGKDTSDTKKPSSSNGSSASMTISDSKEYKSQNADGTLTSVQIAEKVKPSVIAIVTYRNNAVDGEGSGVIMGEDKAKKNTYIVTCAHIIDSAGITSVKVQLEDGTEYDATVVGYDTRTDIAVLSVAKTGLPAAEFGDSTALKVGEPIYAIGNPGGTAFFGSFTGGFVSAIDRPTSASTNGYTTECIQHDAAINPGNSGGALVNSFGQVVGINSSKIAAEEYEGMGFAVPISVAKAVVDDLIANGYVADRAKLGISYVAAASNQTYSFVVKKNDLPAGSIVVATIDDESALKNTEIKEGDMIIAVDGKNLVSTDSLIKIIENGSAGDELTFTCARVNKDYTVKKFEVKAKLVQDKGNSVNTSGNDSDEGFSNPFAE